MHFDQKWVLCKLFAIHIWHINIFSNQNNFFTIVTEKDDKMPKKLTSTSKWHAEAPVCWSKYTTLVNQEISVKIKPTNLVS